MHYLWRYLVICIVYNKINLRTLCPNNNCMQQFILNIFNTFVCITDCLSSIKIKKLANRKYIVNIEINYFGYK